MGLATYISVDSAPNEYGLSMPADPEGVGNENVRDVGDGFVTSFNAC